MCFSASASFIAGTSLSAIGVATVKKTVGKREIPFALLPVLFGIQQLIEGVIWLSFRFDAHVLNTVMTYIYSLFSQLFWPIYIPFSVLLLETVPWRKRVLILFQLVGLGVGLYLLYAILRFSIVSEVREHIIYYSPNFYSSRAIFFYLIATCGSCLVSSHKMINLLGFMAWLFAFIAYCIQATAFRSLWCFFAAILSILVYLYFRFRPAEPPPQMKAG